MSIVQSPDGRSVITRRAGLGLAALALAGWLGLGLPSGPALAQTKPVLVFAAASLKNALDDVNRPIRGETGKKATISYAASSALAKQIESGAPADLFISADLDWMDYLAGTQPDRARTPACNLLGNSLVLIAPKDSQRAPIKIGPGFALAELLGDGRLAMADPTSVPAGQVRQGGARAARRVGQRGRPSVAQAENVRAALALVARGEAPLGIVYQTDAAADPSVKIVGTFPEDTHPPIVYPMAQYRTSTNARRGDLPRLSAAARRAAQRCSRSTGFTVLDRPDGAHERRARPGIAQSRGGRRRSGCRLRVASWAMVASLPFGIAGRAGAGARPVLGQVAARTRRAPAAGPAAGRHRLLLLLLPSAAAGRSARSWPSTSASSSRSAGPARRWPAR